MQPHNRHNMPVARLQMASQLEAATTLPQVRYLLQHALDHDGHLPIGEHIYLKLRSEQKASFEQKLKAGEEVAGAVLAYLSVSKIDQDLYPEQSLVSGEQLVGYAQLLAQPHNQPSRLLGEMVIHPHLRRQGLGLQMLKAMGELGRHGPFSQLDLWAYHLNEQAQEFARHVGLEPARTLHHLRRPASLTLPDYELPADLHLRNFRPGQDDAEWLALNRLVFAGHPENGAWTQADLEMRFVQSWFDPRDFLIVEDESGQMVGFNWTKRVPPRHNDLYSSPVYPEIAYQVPALPEQTYFGGMGEIYIVGLHPSVRGRGLGRGLTLLGLQHLRDQNSSFFALYVDATNTAAVNLYYSLSFTLHHDDMCYSLKLD